MEVYAFIDRIAKSRFAFEGFYLTTHALARERSFRVQFEITYNDNALVVDGGIQRPHGDAPYSFTIEVPFKSMAVSSSHARVRSPQIPELTGRLLSTREGFELLATGANGHAVSLHLRFIDKHAFEVSGMVSLADTTFSFVAREPGQWKPPAVAQVVGLRPPKDRAGT